MRILAALIAPTLLLSSPGAAQRPPDAEALIAAQREGMAPLAAMDGIWRGKAWTMTKAGRHDIVQTERVGPFLGGSVKVIEGRAYDPDGSVGFNAFGTISFDPATRVYTLRSYAMGRKGDFPLELKPDGYVWRVPAGPGAEIRYTAVIGGGKWREVGDLIAGGNGPVRIFEMELERIGDSDWPAANPVPMR